MKTSSMSSIVALLLVFSANVFVDACQACLAAPLHHSYKQQRSQLNQYVISKAASSRALLSKELFAHSILKNNGGILVAVLRGVTGSIKKHPTAKPIMILGASLLLSQQAIPLLRSANDEEIDNPETPTNEEDLVKEEDADSKPMTSAMVATIGIYKNYISPLLPPACRFLPTCSQYGVQAIEEFGPARGCVLTAWRLLRCSPFGGKGYDPPKWPPVPYNYGSY